MGGGMCLDHLYDLLGPHFIVVLDLCFEEHKGLRSDVKLSFYCVCFIILRQCCLATTSTPVIDGIER